MADEFESHSSGISPAFMFSSRAVSSPPHFEDGVFPWTQSTPEDARGRIRTSDLDSLLDDSVRSKSDHSLRIPSSLPKPTGSSSATAANAPPRKPKRLAHRRSRSDPVDAQDIEALRQAASRTSEPVDLSIYLNGDVHVPKHVMLYKTELCKAYLKKGKCLCLIILSGQAPASMVRVVISHME